MPGSTVLPSTFNEHLENPQCVIFAFRQYLAEKEEENQRHQKKQSLQIAVRSRKNNAQMQQFSAFETQLISRSEICCHQGDLNELEILLAQLPHVCTAARWFMLQGGLLTACLSGRLMVVARLLAIDGVSVNETPCNDPTILSPLQAACQSASPASVPIAELLLRRHADPNQNRASGYQPLPVALTYPYPHRPAMVRLLLAAKASVHTVCDPADEYAPFAYCVSTMNNDRTNTMAAVEPLLEMMLEAGAKVDQCSRWGYTPLHLACSTGLFELGRFLLRKGADPNARANNGATPLHHACIHVLLVLGLPPPATAAHAKRGAAAMAGAPPRTFSAAPRYRMPPTIRTLVP